MHEMKRSPRLKGLGLMLVVMALSLGRATADVTTDQPGSIVVFPKVIADGTRDTLIELTNTGNLQQYVHCFYIPSTGSCSLTTAVSCTAASDCPTGEQCAFSHRDFDLVLTRQQPTIWRVSTGRILSPLDPVNGSCSTACAVTEAPCAMHSDCVSMPGDYCQQSCPGTDPGNILAMGDGFRGELRCLLVESDGLPIVPAGGNWLKGEAIIETISSLDPNDPNDPNAPTVAQLSKYNAFAIQAVSGGANFDGDSELELDNNEYNACPAALWFGHLASDASDPVVSTLSPADCVTNGCPVRTEVTLVPCTVMLESEIVPVVPVHFNVYDENEGQNSAEAELYRWLNAETSDFSYPWTLPSVVINRTAHLMTKVTPATDNTGNFPAAICFAGSLVGSECSSDSDCGTGGICAPSPAFLGVVEEFHETDGTLAQSLALLQATNATTMHLVPGRTGRCGTDMAIVCDPANGLDPCPGNCVMDIFEIPLQ